MSFLKKERLLQLPDHFHYSNNIMQHCKNLNFYINLKDNHYLDGKHTVFARVVNGIEVVEKISKVKKGARDKPLEQVKIRSIRLKK